MRTTPSLRAAGLALALLTPSLAPLPAHAQIRGSERAAVSQTIDGTIVTVNYARPAARGRAVFGGLVPWNVVWTPGANWATTFSVNKQVKVGGVTVPAGTYSVWLIPREGPWTLTLNPEPRIFHFQKPDSAEGQIHIAVEAEPAQHVETLTWSFPAVAGDAALLTMHWAETKVPVEILVPPTEPPVIAPQDRDVFLGRYELDLLPGIGWPERGVLSVTVQDGKLRGRLPFPIHPGDELEFDLIPAGRNRFSPGLYHGDELFNVEMGVTFEFEVVAGRARSVTMRGIEGTTFGEGSSVSEEGDQPSRRR